MESATLWLGLAGLLAIAVMMSRSFRGSVFIGIIFVTVIAWIPGHGASYLGAGSPIPGKQAYGHVAWVLGLVQGGSRGAKRSLEEAQPPTWSLSQARQASNGHVDTG